MKIKWYWPAKMLGLIKEVNDEVGSLSVSAKADDFMAFVNISLLIVVFIAAFLISFISFKTDKEKLIKKAVIMTLVIVLILAVLHCFGIAPYIQYYPTGSGFIDITVLENLARGIYHGFIALSIFAGSKIGTLIAGYIKK